jgi:hypothetical protein
MLKVTVVLAMAAGLAVPAAAAAQAPPDEAPPALAATQAPPAPPAETPKPAKAAPRPPGPPEPQMGKLSNVRVDVTISDQRGNQPAITKTVSLTVADRGTGQVRSGGMVRQKQGGLYSMRLDVDLIRPVIEGNKVHATLNVSYDTPEGSTVAQASSAETRQSPVDSSTETHVGVRSGTDVRHSVTVVLENGKPLTIAESADPATDRRVKLQVKATILP